MKLNVFETFQIFDMAGKYFPEILANPKLIN
jgi:hypothetical protein